MTATPPPPPPSSPPPPAANPYAPPPRTEPAPGLEQVPYHRLYEFGRPSRWWSALGILVALIAFFVVNTVLVGVFLAVLVGQGQDVDAALKTLTNDGVPVSRSFLLLTFVSLAASIPVAWGALRACQGMRPRWLASVAPRIRWRWLLTCLGLSVLTMVLVLLVSAPFVGGVEGGSGSSGVNEITPRLRDLLLIVVLLTPLQAAGEEYAFRGYLLQSFSHLFQGLPRVQLGVALTVPAILFALAHGAQDPSVFFDRLTFGILAGVVAVTTGGLEAGIALHVVNNLLAFGIAIFFGDIDEAFAPTGGGLGQIASTVLRAALYLGVVTFVSRRMGLSRTTPRTVLVEPEPRV